MSNDAREHPGSPTLGAAEFDALYHRLKRATNWGASDRRGALNNITTAGVLAAMGEVGSGRTVSLARPIEGKSSPDNPEPCRHEMTSRMEGRTRAAGLDFALDRFVMNVHGNADSHIDALCHVIYGGELYNDVSVDTITPAGASTLSIDVARNGIVGRGVLLDIPRLRRAPWLEPGDHVTADDLTAAERAQHVRIGAGDLLFVRVGHSRRRSELGPWNAAEARSGLHPTAMEFLAERRVAALGSDGNNDTAPSAAQGVAFPVHVLAVNAMGLHLLDYLQFEDLVPLCEEAGHWSFLCVIAPLRLPAATGSPVNPIAIL
ncbi:MAG TPA: cyclase family protein [Acidimicrobiia bacterium]|jgi:kynurenine formamidase